MTNHKKDKKNKLDDELGLALMLEQALLSAPDRLKLSDQGLSELRKTLHHIDEKFAGASNPTVEQPKTTSDEVNGSAAEIGVNRASVPIGTWDGDEVQYSHTDVHSQHSSIAGLLRTLSDWHRWVNNEVENIKGSFGNQTVVRANSERTKSRLRGSRSADGLVADHIWKQGEMVLTLLSSGKRDFIVTLRIEGEAIGKPVRLLWVDEASLHVEPSEPPKLIEFPIEHQDDGSYRVMIPAGIYSARMRAIIAAENRRDDEKIDARLLLPFVEMD